ncbi:DNA-DIRECTED RNA POLYMERASE I AND III SUBUNIT 14K (14 kDa polypeptide) [Encephalitozoon cuniculi GB-M1]|uniref:DNA-DIRECTED RNA POLYMERASE I AND III SUBUNIT 14K (14 kDa polypeptide) n=2 Tax=Encephalitozoon cuniculi TaxID=6035 RepID=Q8SQY2_ENCCU|nr:DNA-directed RNA polymerase core subunit RPC19 [Encephalitozoon cuniculi GB-M1]AGE95010.1 DNA-directed RNA polymerase I and III subunit 14k [Encephalitozoon cuniculi]KMV65016.1 RNA polymerase subunit AC19 [Encephalitozoon cuniculi EcunIII-L]UYI26261.1 DNA-directed RNA polymerase I and III subunit AC19 [Encephalitozoon cuniculi]CAD25969.1 DNA-DIRECTED RNA POLYMERASE I AND III SUBUNIT 14K (14 kDa polypeptide) [Encephalitozoon cuniculi GB-M1]
MSKEPRIKILNGQTVQVRKEDHTIMNPLRWCIGKNFTGEKVELVGYTIPHPSDDISNITIQLCDESLQTPPNLLKKLVEGLECMEAIGAKIASEIERSKGGFNK